MTATTSNIPSIESDEQLEDLLSQPTPQVVQTLAALPGDIVVLGASGKMGPSLAHMAKRASDAAGREPSGRARRVIGVARFSDRGREELESHGIETVQCDLLNEEQVARLPDAELVIFMTGRKFGSTGDEALTWAMNAALPTIVCRRYRRSRIVVLSSGNIYGLRPVAKGGSREGDALQPVGEYAMSCLARERLFEYFSRSLGIPMTLVRLNYACDLRYGVLVDLAERIERQEPIELSMGHFNTIWQGDANAMALAALAHVATPPWVVNVTGPELLSVRAVGERLGQLLGKPVRFVGSEAATALVSDATRASERFGPSQVTADQLIEWVAHWMRRGGRTLNKPTHFESLNGKF